MTRKHLSADEQAEIVRLFEVHGGDIERWPDAARASYGALAASDAMRAERLRASELDAYLNAAVAPETPDDLKSRIAAAYRPPAEKRFRLRVLGAADGLAAFLQPAPAGAFASLAALGFVAALALDQGAPPEYELFAYYEAGGFGALSETGEGALWDGE